MSTNPGYTKYHPKWYRKRIAIFWWVHKWAHTKFILRELTSLAVAFYALVLLWHVRALTSGPQAYAEWSTWLQTPISILLHGIAFVFIMFHSITWFNLAPKALAIRVGKKRIPGALISASNYLAWVVISAVIAWAVLSAR